VGFDAIRDDDFVRTFDETNVPQSLKSDRVYDTFLSFIGSKVAQYKGAIQGGNHYA
jgi:hypothetical protein